ncbi:hypothetical protein HG531_002603 [Fusarium graminearum]|nr:hypothetical protein HG531_002603 [Fusarium graminearum]
MRMAAEESNGNVPVLFSNGSIDNLELFHAKTNMANHDEEIRLLMDSFLEPIFLDGVLHGLNNRVVGISGKVEEKAERHNVETLVLCLELLVARGLGNAIAGLETDVVKVGCEVAVLVVGNSGVVFHISRVGLVKLMIAGRHDVDIGFGVDVILEEALGG